MPLDDTVVFSIRVTFINLKKGPSRIKIYSYVPYLIHRLVRYDVKHLEKLSCFLEEDLII